MTIHGASPDASWSRAAGEPRRGPAESSRRDAEMSFQGPAYRRAVRGLGRKWKVRAGDLESPEWPDGADRELLS
jgi:hypothetical protein